MSKKFLKKTVNYSKISLLIVSLFLMCTTKKIVDPNDDIPVTVKLSLQTEGMVRAEFTGLPINAILQFNQKVNFDDIVWKIGEARLQIPAQLVSDSFSVPLYWLKSLPDSIDETTGYPYQLISVKIGTVVSNVVRADILNMAPIVDSLVVGDSCMVVSPNVFGNNVYLVEIDTQSVCSLKVFAHELDSRSTKINASWRAMDSVRITFDKMSSLIANYHTPTTNFRDSIRVKVYDGDEGEVNLVIVILRTNGIPAVNIDSLTFADTTYYDSSYGLLSYNAVDFDTSLIKVFTSAHQTGVSFKCIYGDIFNLDSSVSNIYSATYVCTSSARLEPLLTDSSFVLDTVFVSIGNTTGDTLVKKILITKVPKNRPPVINEIFINDSLYSDTAMWIVGGGFINLKFTATDPDDTAKTQNLVMNWSSGHPENFASNSGGIATYSTKLSPGYTDTLIATAEDPLGFKSMDTVIVHVNLPPVLDSVYINNKLYSQFTGTPISFVGTRTDTLEFVMFGHDPEYPDVDSMDVIFSTKVGNKLFLHEVNDSTVIYIPPDIKYTDTLVVTVKDVDKFAVSQLFIMKITNAPPSIDSIVINDQSISGVGYYHTFEASVGDTLNMSLYVRDIDGNIRNRTWTLGDSSFGSIKVTGSLGDKAKYITGGKLYTDSLFIAVDDSRDSKTERCIIISVNNRRPVIDSIRIAALTRSTAVANVVAYSSVAPDTIDLTVFSHEPDSANVSINWSATSGIGGLMNNQSKVLYRGLDSAYVDTITVKVTDDKNAVDIKKILLNFTKL